MAQTYLSLLPSIIQYYDLCNVDNNIPCLCVDCINAELFQTNLKMWLSFVDGQAIPIKTTGMIFGMVTDPRKYVNFSILHAKWYNHLNKQNGHHVSFANFLCYFRDILVTEKLVALNQKCTQYFNATF